MYEIKHHNGKFIVYRIVGKRHLRQGSYDTEQKALDRIEASRRLQELREDAI